MFQLRLLGPLSLTTSGEGNPAVLLSQPKRLALLAYLAVPGSGQLERRDKAMTLFWPEQSQERARHALSQGIHVLRRALHPEAIVTLGDGLGLDPSRIWCDAAGFLDLLKSGDLARALELYRGDLMDGFFVSDCGNFERWLEETRRSLRAQAAAAAAQLAEQCLGAGDHRAPDWALRACQLAPFDESAIRRLMMTLEASGNRVAALETFDQFTRRLQSELELSPSAELQAQACAIRSRSLTAAAEPMVELPGRGQGPAQPAVSSAPRRRLPWRMALAAILVGSVGLGATLLKSATLGAAPAEAAALGRVAVLPFAEQGTLTRDDSLGRSLVDLLGSRLDGAGRIQVIPAESILALTRTDERHLAGIAAGSAISGRMSRSQGTLHLHAAWRRVRDGGLIGEATIEGPAADLPLLLDRLAIELLAQGETGPRSMLSRAAAHSTTSVPALKAYLTGEQAFREGHFSVASQAFERSTQLDSSFALAQYRLGVAALWAEDYPLAAVDAGARALRHSGALTSLNRRLLEGFDAWRRGDRDTAVSRYLSVLAVDHDNLEAWFQLGEAQFHYNPTWGLPISEARDAFRQAIRIDPDHWGSLWHLAMLDALEGRTADMDHRLDRLLHLGVNPDYDLEIRALRACAHRDPAGRSGLIEPLRGLGEGRLYDMAWRCAVYGRDLDGAELMGHLLAERHAVRFSEIQGRSLNAYLAMARGRRAQALAELDSLATLSAPMSLAGRTDLALSPDMRASREALGRLRQDWSRWGAPGKDQIFDGWLGRLDAETGNYAEAGIVAAQLDSATDKAGNSRGQRAVAEQIRALVALRRGSSVPALRQAEGAPPEVWFGLMVSSPDGSRASGRFQNAEVLAGAGRLREAVRWYGSLGELAPFDLAYLPAATLRRGDLYLRLADTTAAAREYARFLELWKDADPELQPLVAATRERLTRLSVHR